MSTVPDTRLEQIVSRLIVEFHPLRIILFGSRAWGQPTVDSDFDMLVIVDHSEEKPSKRSTRAYRCLKGITTPIDLLVWTDEETSRLARTTTSLASDILERGAVLYDRRGEAG